MKSNGNNQDAIAIFNDIKNEYASKIDELSDIKRDIFKSDGIDQPTKSKIRITLESLLIDLNEEIFAISEELAKSYTVERQKNLIDKALEYEQRKKAMVKKIKDCIEGNPAIRIARKSQRHSPPQKDLDDRNIYHGSASMTPNRDSGVKNSGRGHKANLSDIISDRATQPLRSSRHHSHSSARKSDNKISVPTKLNNQNSLRKKKTPIPLRRKQDGPSDQITPHHYSSNSFTEVRERHGSALKQQKTYDNRPAELGPGLQGKGRGQKTKKLDEFERFLQQKKKTQMDKENKKASNITTLKDTFKSQKGSREANQPLSIEPLRDSQFSTIQQQSDAFEVFAEDFNHVKNKLLQVYTRLSDNEEKTHHLEKEVERLKSENLKLVTDVKMIRSEHSEILHSLYSMDKKNGLLGTENQALKRIISGERALKGAESNMPKPLYDDVASVTAQETGRNTSPFSKALSKNRSYNQLRDSGEQETSMTYAGRPTNQDIMSFQPSATNLNQVHSFRDERNFNVATRNPLAGIGVGSESNYQLHPFQMHTNSSLNLTGSHQYQQQQPINVRHLPMARAETPTTPNRGVIFTNDTPNSKNPSFLLQQRNTPSRAVGSSAEKMGINPNASQLSDWVIERMHKHS